MAAITLRTLMNDLLNNFLIDLEILNEGLEFLPYTCPGGKLTIGIGHNLEMPISKNAALLIARDDLGIAVKGLMRVFPKFYNYGRPRQYALTDMMFNLGSPRFKSFKKMIAAVKDEDWEKAAAEAKDSRWYVQTKRRAKRDIFMLRENKQCQL